MQTTTVKLYSLPYRNVKTYLAASIFALGNLVMPQLFHLIPQGGMIWLPIYFFTLVGAYKYGWKVGVLTAVLSPLVNSALFGMPAVTALPSILIKSVLLAVVAGYTALHFKKASLGLLLGVVLTYQIVGTLGEWLVIGDFWMAIQDFRIGVPGMAFQVIGGWMFINKLLHK